MSPIDFQAVLDSLLGELPDKITVVPIVGDASNRRYYRISFCRSGKPEETLVVMQIESPQPGKETDYVKLTRFLGGIGVPVPQLYGYDSTKGILLIEDCGDNLFQSVVESSNSEKEVRKWYKKAIDLLANLQKNASSSIGPSCPAYHLRFDVEKLMWEFDFMWTYYVEGLLEKKPGVREKDEIRKRFVSVCAVLADEKRYFVHRDYHCRNLMVVNGELKTIDFQDARMGPRQYDLASLLRDSYVELPEGLIDYLIEYYICLMERDGEKIDRRRFRHVFDLMVFQRNLKAIGTFAYQKVWLGEARYLEDIPRALSHIRKTLDRLPDQLELRLLLVPWIAGVGPE